MVPNAAEAMSGYTPFNNIAVITEYMICFVSVVVASSCELEIIIYLWKQEVGAVKLFHMRKDTVLICNSRYIEDEYPFLLICTLYSELRNRYIPKYYRCRRSVYKFVQLMQTEYSPLLCKIGVFVFHSFKIRKQTMI